jgi:hypothetical protein
MLAAAAAAAAAGTDHVGDWMGSYPPPLIKEQKVNALKGRK